MNKAVGALKKADDAIVVDSTHLTQKQVVKEIEKLSDDYIMTQYDSD